MATHTYEHSKAFDVLKQTKEAVSGNYTSLQYLQTLDYFIWESLRPIAAECPNLFYNYFAKVVVRQTLKPSSKFTSNDRIKLPLQLFNALMEQDQTKAFALTREMYINRGILFGFVSFFLNTLKLYTELQSNTRISEVMRRTLTKRIETSIGLREHGMLYPAMQQVDYWDKKARTWKGFIVEKYTRMTLNQAQKTYTDFNHSVRLDDVVQIYLVVVNRSIDRCDSRQGVLTTFIQNWFKSARGEVAALAEGQQDSSFDALIEEYGDSVHDFIGVTLPNLDRELYEQLAYTAYVTDPRGLVRTSLGIPQYVSRPDRELLEALAYEPS